MNDLTKREAAYDPQDLERLLVARENAGDVSGMTALFAQDAVVQVGDGQEVRGREAIQAFFTKLQVTGFGPEKRKFQLGEQRPALICGDLALTSVRYERVDLKMNVEQGVVLRLKRAHKRMQRLKAQRVRCN